MMAAVAAAHEPSAPRGGPASGPLPTDRPPCPLQVSVRAVAAPQAPSSLTGQPYGRVFNFSAGPAVLPVDVLEQAQADLLNWKGSGEQREGCSPRRHRPLQQQLSGGSQRWRRAPVAASTLESGTHLPAAAWQRLAVELAWLGASTTANFPANTHAQTHPTPPIKQA